MSNRDIIDPYQRKADVTSLDQDLRELRQSKYSPQLANQAKQWIFQIIQEPTPNEDFITVLKTGVVLAKLANKLGASIKFKDSKMPFVQMENISNFLSFIKTQYKVPESELFQTVDLYEENDPAIVLQSIVSLSRYAHKSNPSIPVIGPKLSDKPKPPKKPSHLAGGNTSSSTWSSIEYGYIKGANQTSEGVVFGQKRDIV